MERHIKGVWYIKCIKYSLRCLSLKTFPKPLTLEEEKIYLDKYKEGDKNARDILIERNLRLVAHIAKKYNQVDRDMEELISVGTIGLIKAINSFNGSKGNKLVTYASKCIDNEILMMMRNEKKRQRDVSLYEPVGTDREGNEINLLDIIENNEKDMSEEYAKKEDIKWLYTKIDEVLTNREKSIIVMRYGLYGGTEFTQREVAKILNISRSYVSRIEKKAIQILRNCAKCS